MSEAQTIKGVLGGFAIEKRETLASNTPSATQWQKTLFTNIPRKGIWSLKLALRGLVQLR